MGERCWLVTKPRKRHVWPGAPTGRLKELLGVRQQRSRQEASTEVEVSEERPLGAAGIEEGGC